ncbi:MULTISPECIES: hypothetical protein [unclassified Streptomyces]|uniref:hypothetical protein n=1 Tax=unclassified Streptomyces TaxID=2593676 RepID=UPI0021C6421A|nr:hypothetical protein [Streptomyces sp. FIT100]UUN29254.1 hypothetical protein KK483_24890 [Streptomyces sp. FIT100]
MRCLLDSTLPEGSIRTARVGSTDHVFDPCKEELGPRAWLELIGSSWLAAEARREGDFVPPPPGPVTDSAPRAAVLRGIGPVTADLPLAHEEGERFNPLPLAGLVPALEQVVTHACADLGYLLFLRAVKHYALPVSANCRAEFVTLGERFGYPELLVEQGLQRG